MRKELGGGALLDIGVYCLQFVLMVFDGERPASIQAAGALLDSGRSRHRCRKQRGIFKQGIIKTAPGGGGVYKLSKVNTSGGNYSD